MPARHVFDALGAFGAQDDEQAIQDYIQRRQEFCGRVGKKTCRDISAFEKETSISPIDELPNYLETNVQARFLDAGCGQAVAAMQLAEKFPHPRVRVDAVDILPLETPPKKIKFVQADLTRFCIPDYYHLIGMPFVVPYIPDPLRAIANMCNSLRHSENSAPGILGFSVYPNAIRVDGLPIHYPTGLFRERLKQSGIDFVIKERRNETNNLLYEGMAVVQLIKWENRRVYFDDLRLKFVRPQLGFPILASYSSS